MYLPILKIFFGLLQVCAISSQCIGYGGYQQPIVVSRNRNNDRDILFPLLLLFCLGGDGFGGGCC